MAEITSQRWVELKHGALCPCSNRHVLVQVVGSSMPLVGEHQAQDRQLITDMVLAEMKQLAEREANAPQKPTTTQPSQVGSRRTAARSATEPCTEAASLSCQGAVQKGEVPAESTKNGVGRPPQGCLQYILDCNGVAVGPKQVQAN